MSRALLLLLAIDVAAAAPGCGGGGSANDAGDGAGGGYSGMAGTGKGGGASGAGGAAGAGGGGRTGGAACGGTTCTANQICVHPVCGLNIAVCIPLGDAGQCATGWVMTDSCGPGTGPGCRPPVCDPPPPSCVDVPAA